MDCKGVVMKAAEIFDLAGRIALVTGASSGIGAAVCRVLAEEGADVVVAYGRDHDGAQRTARIVQNMGRRAWLCPMDVRDANAIAAAFETMTGEIDGIDALILSAGYNVITPVPEITPQ